MEENSTENQNKELQIKAKQNQRYIKRVVNNDNLNLEEKLDILISNLPASKEEVEEMINFLGMSLTPSQFSAAKLHTLKNKKRYIISSAQNASDVNLKFLHNIQAYAEHIDAEIGIIATRYKNPTSMFKEGDDVWSEDVHPYLTANRQLLHKNVLLLADLKVQATSPNPTAGIELYGDGASCIVGAPRIEMRTVPVLPNQTQKFLYSTGSVTKPNFTDSVAGGKAAEHHSYGFVIVEVENEEIVHLRSVSANDDGEFNDLIYRVEDGIIFQEDVEYLIWGDCHFGQKDSRITFAFQNLCEDLGIKKSVLHDVFDSTSVNVHNIKDPFKRYEVFKSGKSNLKSEIKQMKQELKWFEENMEKTYVVASNHDDMVDRMLAQGNWYDNLENAETLLKLMRIKLSGDAPDGVIPYIINKKFQNIHAFGLNDSFIEYGVQLALHGHKSSNGSKGSVQSFSRLSQKSIVGHTHSPAIRWGCYQVGLTCKMDHGYNQGLSSWAYASCTLNKHGKRQLIVLNKDSLTYTTLY